MGRIYPWLNQKVTNFLGDFKEEREPEEHPSRTRGVCWILFVVLLMIGFVLLLVYHFMGSRDVRVKLIHHLQEPGKNRDFIVKSLYEKDLSNSTSTLRDPVVCPCSNITVNWREFVSFYTLHETSTEWNMTFTDPDAVNGISPRIDVPLLLEANSTLLWYHLVKDQLPLTAERFCEISHVWPAVDPSIKTGMAGSLQICLYIASTLFPGPQNYQDTRRSAQLLESPILLNREVLNMLVAQRARDSAVRRRLKMDIINPPSPTFHTFYNGLADLLTGILDRDEMPEWESYYVGAIVLSGNLESMVFYKGQNPLVYYLSDPNGPMFLHPEVNWKKFYEFCHPLYCEVTKKMGPAHRVLWASGLVGGVTSIVLGFVSVLLWPAAGILLGCCSKNLRPEHPQATLLSNPGGRSSPAPLSHVMPEAALVTIYPQWKFPPSHVEPEA